MVASAAQHFSSKILCLGKNDGFAQLQVHSVHQVVPISIVGQASPETSCHVIGVLLSGLPSMEGGLRLLLPIIAPYHIPVYIDGCN